MPQIRIKPLGRLSVALADLQEGRQPQLEAADLAHVLSWTHDVLTFCYEEALPQLENGYADQRTLAARLRDLIAQL